MACIKKKTLFYPNFVREKKILSDVGVCAALFRRKIWTKGGWYFLLVALYYCKIFRLSRNVLQESCIMMPRSAVLNESIYFTVFRILQEEGKTTGA